MILTFVTYTPEFFAITSRGSCLICILLQRLCTSKWTFPYLWHLIHESISHILATIYLASVDIIVAWLRYMSLVLILNILISDTISTCMRRSLSLNYIICSNNFTSSSTLSAMNLCQIKIWILINVKLRLMIISHSCFNFSLVTQITKFGILFICRCFLLIIHVLFILWALIYHNFYI